MIPEPWSGHETIDEDKRGFYEFHASMMEPWDGPASIAFTDGETCGAVLDRNGLRPSRYYVTKDGLVIMASEVGVVPVDEADIAYKGRLQPGKMFLIDIKEGRIISDEEIWEALAETFSTIVEAVKIALERTPPELAADIVDKGIVVAGGGSLIHGLDALLREATGLPISLASDALSAVALGSGKVLSDPILLKKVSI